MAKRGQELFLSPTEGKCFACHSNAGANGDPVVFGPNAGNLNFNTGVEDLPDQPQDLTGERVPPDDGFGIPGDGTFNTPSVIEAADTGPFFHNNSIETIEGSVAFYNGDAFNNSPAGQLLQQATGSGINLDGTQVVEVAAFLRVINALENIRQSIEMLEPVAQKSHQTVEEGKRLLDRAAAETEDSIMVLSGEYTVMGKIDQVNPRDQSIKMSGPSDSYTVKLTEHTFIYLDRSKVRLPNTYGTLADCKVGDTVEVKFEDNSRSKPIEWIKVQKSQ